MAMSISMSVGRPSYGHNIRKGHIPKNVDSSLSEHNEVLCDKLSDYIGSDTRKLEAYTNDRFQGAIDRYNEKQKRADRKKDRPYMDYFKDENAKLVETKDTIKKENSKRPCRQPAKLIYEYVFQLGNRDNNSTVQIDGYTDNGHIIPKRDGNGNILVNDNLQASKAALRDIYKEIENKYPHCEIVYAVIHCDEPNGTPHMHIAFQFVGEGYKQGLDEQISLTKALECDGFKKSNKREQSYSIERWRNDIEENIMVPALKTHLGEDREQLDIHRAHVDSQIFPEVARKNEKAIAAAVKEAERIQADAVAEKVKIEGEIKDLNDTLNGISDEYERKTQFLAGFENTILDKGKVIKELDGQISAANTKLSETNDKIREKQSDLNDIINDYTEKKAYIDAYPGKKKKLDDEINLLNFKISEKNADLSDVSIKIDSLKSKKNRLLEEISGLETTKSNTEEELDGLNVQLSAFQPILDDIERQGQEMHDAMYAPESAYDNFVSEYDYCIADREFSNFNTTNLPRQEYQPIYDAGKRIKSQANDIMAINPVDCNAIAKIVKIDYGNDRFNSLRDRIYDAVVRLKISLGIAHGKIAKPEKPSLDDCISLIISRMSAESQKIINYIRKTSR